MTVILTKEQAEAIEAFKSIEGATFEDIANNKPFHLFYKPFNEMKLDDIIKAVYEGYEIEKPKFVVGDKVVDINCPKCPVITIKSVERGRIFGVWGKHETSTCFVLSNARYATKEEIFWAELGREVGEFVVGDVLLCSDNTPHYVKAKSNLADNWISVDEAKEWCKDGDYIGFYPAESFKQFPTGDLNES